MATTRTFTGKGGSQSGNAAAQGSNSGKNFLFQKGISYVIPSDKKHIKGRILPAFDPDMSPNDKNYLTSIAPYRDVKSGDLDAKTGSPAFTDWHTMVAAYRFFGPGEFSFLSPHTLQYLGCAEPGTEDAADPVDNIRQLIYSKYKADYEYLVKKVEGSKARAAIPRPSIQGLINFYYCDLKHPKDGWKTEILIVSEQAIIDLKEKLCWPTTRAEAPIDEDFPNYLFGDITHPENGAVARIESVEIGSLTPHGFVFSDSQFSTKGATFFKADDSVLAVRKRLASSEVLNVLSYQQIADIVADAKLVPYEIMAEACGHMADIKEYAWKSHTTHSTPDTGSGSGSKASSSGQSNDFARDTDDDDNMDMTPVATKPAVKVTAPAKAAAPVKQTGGTSPTPKLAPKGEGDQTEAFWASGFGAPANTKPTKKTRQEVESLMVEGLNGKVRLLEDDGTGWVTPDRFNMGVIDLSEEAPDGPDDDTPDGPDDEAPDGPSPLTEAESARFTELLGKVQKRALGTDEVGELAELSVKSKG